MIYKTDIFKSNYSERCVQKSIQELLFCLQFFMKLSHPTDRFCHLPKSKNKTKNIKLLS